MPFVVLSVRPFRLCRSIRHIASCRPPCCCVVRRVVSSARPAVVFHPSRRVVRPPCCRVVPSVASCRPLAVLSCHFVCLVIERYRNNNKATRSFIVLFVGVAVTLCQNTTSKRVQTGRLLCVSPFVSVLFRADKNSDYRLPITTLYGAYTGSSVPNSLSISYPPRSKGI